MTVGRLRCVRRVCLLVFVMLAAAAAAGDARDALALASRAPAVRTLPPGAEPKLVRVAPDQWQVRWYQGGNGRSLLEVDVNTTTASIQKVWRGDQLDYPMARGYPGFFSGNANALWFWIPLCVLFVAPFADPRRPFRLLHLDLLVVVSLSVSLAFFNHGRIDWSVPLVYPPLLYLLGRSLFALRRRQAIDEQLVPYASRALLIAGIVVALAARTALNVADTGTREFAGYGPVGSHVVDVGYAGVVGADRIEHGQQLYTRGGSHLDTYGPLNYLAYVPFELVFPYRGVWDELPAAHAAALVFDLAVMLLLLLAGMRMRAGPSGQRLGLAVAFAWAACPWTAYVLMSNTDDALVALGVAGALALWTVPFARGLFVGAGTAVKFAPVVLLPAAMAGGRRAALLALLAFAALVVIVTVPLLPDGGLREFYDTTIGYQLGTPSPFSAWGRYSGIAWLHTLVKVGAVAVALGAGAAAIRRADDVRVAAGAAAAALLAAQIAGMHWIYFYLVWALPALFIAIFGAHRTDEPAS